MAEYLPPFHPAAVHLPIALMTLSFFADLFHWLDGKRDVSPSGTAALYTAFCGALLSAALGWYDMERFASTMSPQVHEEVHFHMYVGLAVTAALLLLVRARRNILKSRYPRIRFVYLFYALIVLCGIFFQGFLGAELVFKDGVGVKVPASGQMQPAEPAASPEAPAEPGAPKRNTPENPWGSYL